MPPEKRPERPGSPPAPAGDWRSALRRAGEDAALLTGLIGVAAVVRCRSGHALSKKSSVVNGILQFVFCADVVSAVVVFVQASRRHP